MPLLLFEFHMATAINSSLYEEKNESILLHKLRVIESAEIGKLVENLEEMKQLHWNNFIEICNLPSKNQPSSHIQN